jgi:2-methylcitrate dehydratase PrpD
MGTAVQDVVELISGSVAGLKYEMIPQAAVEATKCAMLDTLAVGWAGTAATTCPEIYQQFRADGGRPEATVWGYGERLPAASTAYVNSLFASALDYDSIHGEAVIHSDIVVLPAVLAIAERQECSGREFLTSLIAGSDLACRLGLSTERSRGWFCTSTFGVIGAAAGASKLLGHGPILLQNAISLAFLQASGSYQAALEQSLAKRHLSALAARAGVFAAILADSGVSAPKQVFQGRFGLYALYDNGDPDMLVRDLGRRFEGANVNLKYYPCCYCSHAAIDGVLALKRERSEIQAENVERVQLVLSAYMNQLVGAPFDPSENPQVTAQFSVRYAVAVALLRGRFALEDLETAAILDPVARNIASRVDVIVDPANQGTVAPVDIVLTMRNQETIRRRVASVPGMSSQPLTNDQLLMKFRGCTGTGLVPLSEDKRNLLLKRIFALEEIQNMRHFFHAICVDG